MTDWIKLESLAQWSELIGENDQFNVVFKHSTRCGVSSMSLRSFEDSWTSQKNCKIYLLDLLAHRDISNQISIDLNVIHQSPHVILMKNNEVLYSASHSNIEAQSLISRL